MNIHSCVQYFERQCPSLSAPYHITNSLNVEINSLMEKSSTHENIGQSNLYSFHSLASSHLHLTECKPGLISIAQVSTNALLINIIDAIAEQKNTLICNIFLTTIYGAAIPPTRAHREENPTPMVLQEIQALSSQRTSPCESSLLLYGAQSNLRSKVSCLSKKLLNL